MCVQLDWKPKPWIYIRGKHIPVGVLSEDSDLYGGSFTTQHVCFCAGRKAYTPPKSNKVKGKLELSTRPSFAKTDPNKKISAGHFFCGGGQTIRHARRTPSEGLYGMKREGQLYPTHGSRSTHELDRSFDRDSWLVCTSRTPKAATNPLSPLLPVRSGCHVTNDVTPP